MSRFCLFIPVVFGFWASAVGAESSERPPNIFIAISDDVSFPHAGAYGSRMVHTPAFDRTAASGALFRNAFCAAPGCSPSRAALLTGRHIWMIEEAGTHASYFQTKYRTFPEVLGDAGYFCGSTGKAWGPGNFKKNGRTENPAGRTYGGRGGYVAGFKKFLDARPENQPFCFWFGSHDAHRGFTKDAGINAGKKLADAEVPAFLPDAPEIRSDLLDYAFEIDRFDRDCDTMLKMLQEHGELENTLVIITSDNGMAFPRAKANCYEYGIHMPLAISWPKQIPAGQDLDTLTGFVDLTATIYDAAGVAGPTEFPPVGVSLLSELKDPDAAPTRPFVLSGRERHSSSRYNSLGYPQRAIRTTDYLYIHNFRADRWPAGTPSKYSKATYSANGSLVKSTDGPDHGGYHDIDACPSLDFLIRYREHPEYGPFLGMSVDKRTAEELFDIRTDPACLKNLAGNPEHAAVQKRLRDQLMESLKRTGDARVLDGGDIWETYPRVSSLRWFATPDWATQNPETVPKQEWLDQRRPKK